MAGAARKRGVVARNMAGVAQKYTEVAQTATSIYNDPMTESSPPAPRPTSIPSKEHLHPRPTGTPQPHHYKERFVTAAALVSIFYVLSGRLGYWLVGFLWLGFSSLFSRSVHILY